MATLDRNNPFQTQLFERNVLTPYLKDYRNNTQFSKFMGGANAIIHNELQLKDAGDTIVFPVCQTLSPVVKHGTEQLAGNEGEFYTDAIYLGNRRLKIRITDQQLLELQTKATLGSDIRDKLLWKASVFNTTRIVTAFGLSFSPTTINNRNLINYDWAYSEVLNKMIACGIDAINAAGDAISNQRVMFGQDFRTNEATVADVLIKDDFSTANGHVMGVKHISKLVTLARTGGRASATYKELSIRRCKVENLQNGYTDERYILFMAPDTYNHMRKNDQDWQDPVLRESIENQYLSLGLYVSHYKGSIEEVDVIVVDELNNFVSASGAGGSLVGYSVLCGASALGFGMGCTPNFKTDVRDYEMHKGLAHIEISGIKALKYQSKGINSLLVDNGMVHSFVKLS